VAIVKMMQSIFSNFVNKPDSIDNEYKNEFRDSISMLEMDYSNQQSALLKGQNLFDLNFLTMITSKILDNGKFTFYQENIPGYILCAEFENSEGNVPADS
jgi:hypothetical protein